MKKRSIASGLALLVVIGCDDPEVVHVYEPYSGGPVFPNRRPQIALPAGEVGFTSDNGSDTVTVLDLSSGEVLASAPVGRNPIDNDGPHHMAVDRALGLAFVALSYPVPALAPGPHSQHGLGTRAGFVQKLALDDLRPLGEVRVDENPGDIVLSQDGSRVIVSHYDLQRALENVGNLEAQRATLAVMRPDEILEIGSPNPPRITVCIGPHAIALSRPDGAFAYVACYGEDSVAVVNTNDPAAEIVRVPVGSAATMGFPNYGPYSATLSTAGDRVALGNLESADVRIFDADAQTMTSVVISTPGQPFFVAWSQDDSLLYIPTQLPDELIVADAMSGAVISSRQLGSDCVLPHEVVPNAAGDVLYVVCEGDHQSPGNILALDAITLETQWSTAVGVYPDRLEVKAAP